MNFQPHFEIFLFPKFKILKAQLIMLNIDVSLDTVDHLGVESEAYKGREKKVVSCLQKCKIWVNVKTESKENKKKKGE